MVNRARRSPRSAERAPSTPSLTFSLVHVEPDPLSPDEQQLADQLTGSRPVPSAGFRGQLGRRLAARDPGYGPRPDRLRLMVGCYLGAGVALMAVGLAASGAL